MPPNSKSSFLRELKYWTILMIVMLLLFEMASAVYFNYRYGGNKFALKQTFEKLFPHKPRLSLYHQIHQQVRPDSSAETTRQIADEIWDANVYTYEPWLQFRVSDIKRKYVNVQGFVRKSIPDSYINKNSSDTIDIYFFGGSTMYGYNLSDAETIPSQFVKLYKNKYPNGKSLRVHNYGIPYYFSKQELLLYSKLVFEGHRPDMVVFMDGLNDFYPSRMLYYDKAHFSYALEQTFDNRLFLQNKRNIVDTSDQYYLDPAHIPAINYYQELAKRYISHIKHATQLSDAIGTKSFFFCQPVPFYRYPNRDKDPISYKINYDRFDHVYPLLEKQQDSIANFTFLGNMLEREEGLPFIDQVHYSPSFITKITEEIFKKMEPFLLNQLTYTDDGKK